MGINVTSRKMLWGRSGNRCNHPDCRIELIMSNIEGNSQSIIGQECHIVAQSEDGPRGVSSLAEDERDEYNNLILMCSNHHKLIDDQPNIYTVNALLNMKNAHERWVSETLAFSLNDQRVDEIYSSYIDFWCKALVIDNWEGLTSFLLYSDRPRLHKAFDQKLFDLNRWLLARIWPHKYIELEKAFINFRSVLNDFYIVFHCHSELDKSWYITNRFYKIPDWNVELYHNLCEEYGDHVDLVQDLVLELTRAANYICDMVRKYILSDFRTNEGKLLVTTGPDFNLTENTLRAEYREEEQTSIPYPGLEAFILQRLTRDFHFAKKQNRNEYSFKTSNYLGNLGYEG